MIRTLVLRPGGPRLENRLPPVRSGRLALVRPVLVGICRTDLAAAAGAFPGTDGLAFGHEFSAVVCESPTLPAGTLVSAQPFLGGRFRGTEADGVCSEAILAEDDSLVPFPAGFDPAAAAMLEPACASIAPLGALPSGTDRALVVGTGRLADLAAAALAERIPVDRLDPDLAAEAAADPSFPRSPFVVETCAALDGMFDAAAALCIPGGTLCLKSRIPGKTPIRLGALVARGIRVVPALYGDWTEARDFVVRNRSLISSLCGRRFPLDRWSEALEAAGSGEELKTFIRIGPDPCAD